MAVEMVTVVKAAVMAVAKEVAMVEVMVVVKVVAMEVAMVEVMVVSG